MCVYNYYDVIVQGCAVQLLQPETVYNYYDVIVELCEQNPSQVLRRDCGAGFGGDDARLIESGVTIGLGRLFLEEGGSS